ncbi:MAG: hypothetical protein ACM32E_06040 [Gemmatimonadota bacterium]
MPSAGYDIGDISKPDELIRYAARAQIDLVRDAASQTMIAKAIGMANRADTSTAGANLSHLLASGTFGDARLQKLDEVIVALAPDRNSHIGGLSSLAICLRGLTDRESLGDRVPASWTQEILRGHADDEVGVLTQASALLSAFLAAEEIDKIDPRSRAVRAVRGRYSAEIAHVVEQLIILGYAPPTPRSVEALIMLGTLGAYAFEPIRDALEEALTQPLGFRVWRVITTLVMLRRRTGHTQALRTWVRSLLKDADRLRDVSLYPGRSLDLELAIRVPSGWSPPKDDWVGAALLARASNPMATIQERGTAAMGLWQRAKEDQHRDLNEATAAIDTLIKEFETQPQSPDVYSGMRWVAATLKHVMANDVGVCNDWPETDEPWMGHVNEAAGYIERHLTEPRVLPGTRTLLRHSVLQSAAIYRRQAIEALVAGGWTAPVARALERFLELEPEESWLRIRALFALGFLQHRDRGVQKSLVAACQSAYSNLLSAPTRTQIAEMHSALFAVGDCFGAAGVPEEDVRRTRDGIQDVLTGIAAGQLTTREPLFSVSRACAYLLTFMVLPRINGSEDLAEVLLRELSRHPDRTTRELSGWALANRIGEAGAVKPLVHARL